MDIDDEGAHWWNIGRYCYICGMVARIPLIGYSIVSWHLDRVTKKLGKM